MSDTIFAPLTIKGKCSIYTIRISGAKVVECLDKLGIKKPLNHRFATLCHLKDSNDNNLDDALVVYFKAPNSFTGEDICEISLHCSTYIINTVFNILNSIKGVRIAEHGEFSKRAFLNNKLDLIQAEAIADLVNSETELQHFQAIRQLKGENSKFYNELRSELLNVFSNIQAFIDFPEDDDVDVNALAGIQSKINKIKDNIKAILNDNKVGQIIKNGLNISIIGRPNVGKSSLLNYLASKDIAIVSDIAGTTRDIVQVSLDICGIPVIISDTAGIRDTNNIIEQEGIKRAIKNATEADLKILLLDSSDIYNNQILYDLIDENTIVVLNKIDLLNNEDIKKINKQINAKNIINISIKDKINLDQLIDNIKDFIEKNITPYSNTNITQERHRNELINAFEALDNVDFNLSIEINAEHIRVATFCIGKITGYINTEEVLDNIFSKFCIGK